MADRILVAFDESPQATAALRHVLSTYPDADVHVVHVNDPREWVYAGEFDGGYYSESAREAAEESAARLLADAEAIAEQYDVTLTTATEVGPPADAVVGYAEERDVDHIVVGSHGRTGLSRFLLGSVAERITRQTPVSVTIIREVDAESTR